MFFHFSIKTRPRPGKPVRSSPAVILPSVLKALRSQWAVLTLGEHVPAAFTSWLQLWTAGTNAFSPGSPEGVPVQPQSPVPEGRNQCWLFASLGQSVYLSVPFFITIKQRWQVAKRPIHLPTWTQKASTVYSSSIQLLDYGAMGHHCELQHWYHGKGGDVASGGF